MQESKMAAVYDDLLRDSILLRKDLDYALVGCRDKQVQTPPSLMYCSFVYAQCPGSDDLVALTHYEIWKYCQSTSKVHAQVLENVRV